MTDNLRKVCATSFKTADYYSVVIRNPVVDDLLAAIRWKLDRLVCPTGYRVRVLCIDVGLIIFRDTLVCVCVC